ncbi:MAG: hypothetical protein J6C30_00915, partial [Lentisphaeria bacterium]|nr:hypothetical protein [Lentisphaeria bacterium]
MIPFDKHKFDFTMEEIRETASKRGLLTIEIEFNRTCNYRCPYCYAAGGVTNVFLDSVKADEVIRQAKA